MAKRDSMPQFAHKEVISNSCSGIACRAFHNGIDHAESDISDIVLLW